MSLSKVLQQLQEGHTGFTRMKALARSYVYWPDIGKDIEAIVKQCQSRADFSKAPVKAPLASLPITDKPWNCIHIDYAGPFEGHYFLVVGDSYSKWPEIFMTYCATSFTTLRFSAQFGMLEMIVSDNGTQFTSADFVDFCTRNGINHIFSPPYHPQSNRQVKRFVSTFKRTLRKLRRKDTTAKTVQTFPLSHRTAEVLLGRQLRTSIYLIRPTPPAAVRRNDRMEADFNRRYEARYRSFTRGDLLLARNYPFQKTRWAKGVVLRRHGRVTYNVLVGSEIWKRHANQFRGRSTKQEATQEEAILKSLLDDFDARSIPQVTQGAPVDQSAVEQRQQLQQNDDDQHSVRAVADIRRTTRNRHAPQRFSLEDQRRTCHGPTSRVRSHADHRHRRTVQLQRGDGGCADNARTHDISL
uniref:RNA-directed DNA polymerase n=1 Tax=Parascaris univalens TaxID=6257 RepID=A0A915A7J6_PARUN